MQSEPTMNVNESASGRHGLLSRLFPAGVPRLWCPMLTHFAAARTPDATRIRTHLEWLSPYVHGILVPGSTGEGWEMTDEDIRVLLDLVLDVAHKSNMHVLVGLLKTDVDAMLASLDAMQDLLGHPAVAGITICPPKGAELSQSAIRDGLCRVLEAGWPTALYQLPQVTENEMNPATVASLASEFPNFILFKDTSGCDEVATSGVDLGGVFMVRGSEQGGYATWPRAANGPYDGFLLSTANVFAREIDSMMHLLDDGEEVSARAISDKLVRVVEVGDEVESEAVQHAGSDRRA